MAVQAQINADTWDGLSQEMKDIISTASKEALDVANSADRSDIAGILEDLSGTIEFYEPTEAEFNQWRDAAMGIWPEFTGSMDQDILARVQEVQ